MKKEGDGVCRGSELIRVALARVLKMLAGALCSSTRFRSCRTLLFFCFCSRWLLRLVHAATGDIRLMALVPTATEAAATSTNDGYYFPQANALASMMRLAAEHVNKDGTLLLGNVTISVETVAMGDAAGAAGLCSSLLGEAESGETSSIFGVGLISE